MIGVLSWVYIAVALCTYWYDSSMLYTMGYSYLWSVLAGAIDGLIWPIRWGWDLVIWVLNNRGRHE